MEYGQANAWPFSFYGCEANRKLATKAKVAKNKSSKHKRKQQNPLCCTERRVKEWKKIGK